MNVFDWFGIGMAAMSIYYGLHGDAFYAFMAGVYFGMWFSAWAWGLLSADARGKAFRKARAAERDE